MKRRIFISISLIFLSVNLFSQTFTNDTVLFNEIKSNFEKAFYPGLIQQTIEFEKKFPQSAYYSQCKILKAQAFINLDKYLEAKKELDSILPNLSVDSEEYMEAVFFSARIDYELKNYESCINKFYKAAKASIEHKNEKFYIESNYYSGKAFFYLSEYKKSYDTLEKLEKNIRDLEVYEEIYVDSCVCLFESCEKTEDWKQIQILYESINVSRFSSESYLRLELKAANASLNRKEYLNAYKMYLSLVECDFEDISLIAFKKAFLISEIKELNIDSAEVFTKAYKNLESKPELLVDFWIRLGIEEYNKKNYHKALDYFNSAKEMEESVKGEFAVLKLYEAKIAIDKDRDFITAEKLLNKAKEYGNLSNELNYGINENLIICYFNLNKNKALEELYGKIQKPSSKIVYTYSYRFYKERKYNECIRELRKGGISLEQKIPLNAQSILAYELLANTYLKTGDLKSSALVYEKILLAGLMTSEMYNEYAKLLYKIGNYSLSFKYASYSKESESEYICAISLVNLQRWNEAIKYFVSYIRKNSSKEDFIKYSYYFKAFAEYNKGDFKNSYASFMRYALEDEKNLDYLWKAYDYASKSALQNQDYKNAIVQAENAIRVCNNEDNKNLEILFLSEIYSDKNDYEKAIKILNPYVELNNNFSIRCLNRIAEIYTKQGNIQQADKIYTKIFIDYANTDAGEEACFNLGQLHLTSGNYTMAENRFNRYIYEYPNGTFYDAALFYCGQCNLKLQAYEKSILMTKTLLSKYKDSIYTYGSYVNLMEAYEGEGDYREAFEAAKKLLVLFPKQAADNGIGRKANNYEKLISGYNTKFSTLLEEYEKSGKENTVQGRIVGSKLVKLYAEDGDSYAQAVDLAKKLLDKQLNLELFEEGLCTANNCEFLAEYYRQEQNHKKASEYYLKASELYRKFDENHEKSAPVCLYSACDSLYIAGMEQDAKATANLLKTLYPDSRQAKRVDLLFKNF